MDSIFEEVKRFESRLGLPVDFYSSLLEEDDWGFVIKLHSLFEAAATFALIQKLDDQRLEAALTHLDFGHTKFGKIRLLADLGVVNKNQGTFLRKLCELRNTLVHDVQYVSFSFNEHVEGFDKNQLQAFINWAAYDARDTIKIGQVSVTRNQFVRENPKLVIWLSGSEVLACLRLEEELAALKKRQTQLAAQGLNLMGAFSNFSDLAQAPSGVENKS